MQTALGFFLTFASNGRMSVWPRQLSWQFVGKVIEWVSKTIDCIDKLTVAISRENPNLKINRLDIVYGMCTSRVTWPLQYSVELFRVLWIALCYALFVLYRRLTEFSSDHPIDTATVLVSFFSRNVVRGQSLW